ncbi:MAG: Uma2 family endonuclease [Myxococcales bacterium]|nr:Uma2 family endonuclease [Myxococcales bacterium]MCB9672119.1 Uma2 family endonuclease [Alphaproteobacteria bacterium]MCB9691572.1 Uma2 family endonuclease [Alphaproteobacteria bacterium]
MEARRIATYADLLAVPDHQVGELVAGELRVSPRPAPAHAWVSSSLGADLLPPFARGRGGPGGWWILDEPEVHLGDDVLVPDLAGWRRTTLPALPTTSWFATRPDWVCEVASPSTEAYDRLVKLEIYGRAGVPWAWIVDPIARYIEVFERVDDAWRQAGGATDATDARLPPFEAVPLDVGAIWPPDPMRDPSV